MVFLQIGISFFALVANKINNEDNATNKPKILPLTVKCVYDGDLLLAELECPRALATP